MIAGKNLQDIRLVDFPVELSTIENWMLVGVAYDLLHDPLPVDYLMSGRGEVPHTAGCGRPGQ